MPGNQQKFCQSFAAGFELVQIGFGLGLRLIVAVVHHCETPQASICVGVDLAKQCLYSFEIRCSFCSMPQSGSLCSFFFLSCLSSSSILLSLKVGSLVVEGMREYVPIILIQPLTRKHCVSGSWGYGLLSSVLPHLQLQVQLTILPLSFFPPVLFSQLQ